MRLATLAVGGLSVLHTSPQVSEKILALDEDNKALRLAAGEAASKMEALMRERGTLMAAQEELRAEVGGGRLPALGATCRRPIMHQSSTNVSAGTVWAHAGGREDGAA